jgi:NADH-quinone oxidoreductase subunit N
MFSLAGIPPTAGFVGKFYIFMAALDAGLVWLAVIGVLMSAVSAFFYLRIIKIMYMDEPASEFELETSFPMKVAVPLSFLFVLIYGMYPSGLVDFVRSSLSGIF